MLWWVGILLIVVWFVLYFVLHQRGLVHMLVIAGFSLLFIQFMAYRKTKYQRDIARK